jgi:hypothetical protein
MKADEKDAGHAALQGGRVRRPSIATNRHRVSGIDKCRTRPSSSSSTPSASGWPSFPPAPVAGSGAWPASRASFLAVTGWMADETTRRLTVLARTTDGFQIAEADLLDSSVGPGGFSSGHPARPVPSPSYRVANLMPRTTALLGGRSRTEAVPSGCTAHDPNRFERPEESAVLRAVLAPSVGRPPRPRARRMDPAGGTDSADSRLTQAAHDEPAGRC